MIGNSTGFTVRSLYGINKSVNSRYGYQLPELPKKWSEENHGRVTSHVDSSFLRQTELLLRYKREGEEELTRLNSSKEKLRSLELCSFVWRQVALNLTCQQALMHVNKTWGAGEWKKKKINGINFTNEVDWLRKTNRAQYRFQTTRGEIDSESETTKT